MSQSTRDYLDVGRLDKAETNMAVVRAAYKAIDAGDVDRFFADFAPDAVAYDADGLPYGGVYAGRDGWMRLMKAMFGAWESATWDIQQITAGGDLVIVYFQMTFKAKGAAPFKHPILELWRLRNGKVIELRPFYYDTKLISQVLSAP